MKGDTLDSLRVLQEIDATIAERRARLRALEAEHAQLSEELAALEGRTDGLRSRMEQAEVDLRQAERTVQAGRETLKRLQGRAQEVHNMREHLAARTEVDASRQNLEIAEDQLLEAMQEQESARSAMSDLQGDIASRGEEYGERMRELDAERDRLEEEIAVQIDKRSNRALRLDAGARSLYDTVRGGRADSPLAPLVDGVCGHCFTAIPLQTQQVIRSGRTLVVCETCGVILHVAE
jgi:predicted  nucleic acid-binding Zn-ribbon protein